MRKTIDEYKKDISIYINSYLENDDEFTEMNEEKFRKIQNDDEILTRLATELYNNEVLNAIEDIDKFNIERNYYISELLDKER
ncbi:MAG: hypothetical protein IKC22_00635 [Bacilli bacterium]|mgnify:FL=1|nr:hypothetical protein [bacterium]MBR2890888.1 hypothetical protein [Bacilli bacterium]